MVIRQLKQSQYDSLLRQLSQNEPGKRLEASYTTELNISGVGYQLKIQLEKHCKIAALQAVRITQGADGRNFELVTQNNLLSALLEVFIDRGGFASSC